MLQSIAKYTNDAGKQSTPISYLFFRLFSNNPKGISIRRGPGILLYTAINITIDMFFVPGIHSRHRKDTQASSITLPNRGKHRLSFTE